MKIKIEVRQLRQLLHQCISIIYNSKTIVESIEYLLSFPLLKDSLHLFNLTLVREVSKDSLVQSIT